jgi:hypothetical protein
MVDRQDPKDVIGKKKSKFAGALAKIEQDLHALQTGGDGLAVGADFKPNLPLGSVTPVSASKVNKPTDTIKRAPEKPSKPATSPTAKR